MQRKFLYNNEFQKQARILRKSQTNTEQLLWSKLRGRRLNNCKFYRQFPVGSYIIDFYCPRKKFAIEMDGGQHFEIMQKASDIQKEKYLSQRGIKTIRFFSNEVLSNLTGVLEYLSALTSP